MQPGDHRRAYVDREHPGTAVGQRQAEFAGPRAEIDNLVARTDIDCLQDCRTDLLEAGRAMVAPGLRSARPHATLVPDRAPGGQRAEPAGDAAARVPQRYQLADIAIIGGIIVAPPITGRNMFAQL